MSTQPSQNQNHNVIDLTDEPPSPIVATRSNVHPLNRRRSPAPRPQRGPRYERNIIDTESNEGTPATAVDLRENSPEVQFIRERPRSESANSRTHRPTNHRSRLVIPRNPPSASPERSRVRSPPRLPLPWQPWGPPSVGLFIAPTRRPFHRGDELIDVDDWHLSTGPFIDPEGHFEMPDFNFGLQGFNLEHPSRPVEQLPRLPTYTAPPPARAGFTRDLKEDDVLVCPNCDDELGVGDNDIKRQVWVSKPCGHVSDGIIQFSDSITNNIPPSRSTAVNVQGIDQPLPKNPTLNQRASHSKSAWPVIVGRL